jgi:hypothetical protein
LVAIESRNYKINFTMFITIKAVSREAGTMWRKGGQIFVKGHFWIDIY